ALPFSWNGVTLYATGATTLRVRITPSDEGLALHAVDPSGQPVLTVDRLVTRPVGAELTARTDGLFQLSWPQVTPTTR
ncbi:hypothetical protein GTY62_30930, partial [Streptomyces sp. SID724]|nr:hypothetical protein [Streptomyces sp. SID724]